MTDSLVPAGDLGPQILDTYREEYRDVSDTWRSVDTKAQGTGAIAGIFLAATFALARDLPRAFGGPEKAMLVAGILLLVFAVVAAVVAMQVRTVSAPPAGSETDQMIADIERVGVSAERLSRFYRDQATAWKDTNSELQKHALRKARWLLAAQVALLVAAGLVAILTIVSVLHH